MNKKYEITSTSKVVDGVTLYQIKALKSFWTIREGELGGWIEKEENLSHDRNAWVFKNACVYGNARVYDDAKVFDNARVYDDAQVYDNARVSGNAWVYCNAIAYDNAKVFENAKIYGHAAIGGYAQVYGETHICGFALIAGSSRLSAKAKFIKGNFIGGDDSGKITNITEQTGTPYWKYQYVLGDYEIEPIKDIIIEKREFIEIDGKKYELIEVTK